MADAKPKKYTITRARGRNTSTPTREPVLTEIEFAHEDGHVISAALPKDGRSVLTETRVLVEVRGPVPFATCVICGSGDVSSKEHVPPQKLGGGYVTRTCPECNNLFGSKYEEEARRWWEYEFSSFSLTHSELRGPRHLKNARLRETSKGNPLILLELPDGHGYEEAFATGAHFSFGFTPPDPALWRWALLKSAYVAACIVAGGPIDSDEAKKVRQMLIAARDAPKDAPPPLDLDFSVARIDREAVPGLIQFVATRAEGEASWRFGLLLADVLYVTWVFGSAIEITFTDTGRREIVPLP